MKKLIVLPFLFFSVLSFASPTEKQINACRSLNNNDLRLTCYDVLFSHNAKKVPKSDKNTGDWLIDSNISPIDDSTNVYIHLAANETVINDNKEEKTPVLTIRCQENQTDIYIHWYTRFNENPSNILTRVDKNKANTQPWIRSTDHIATFHEGGTVSFIKSLIGKNLLFVQAIPNEKGRVSLTFTLTGIDEAIKPLRQSCGW